MKRQSKKSKKNWFNYSVVLPSLFLLTIVSFLLLNRENINYLSASTQIKSSSLHQDDFSFPFYESQLLGTWYLKGYKNASVTFIKEGTDKNVLNIKSENIDLLTLNTFPEGSYLSGIRESNLNEIIESYNIKLIGGKLGTLYLTKDNQTLEFLRYKTKNAKEGLFKTNCRCSTRLSCGN
ncbi:MAG TPA: hypothetical protein PLT51_04315 [Candidatus Dojkabacteria bacterium]|nr:hypothetical protein [Candidatus Dojkabacteria bacterium]